MTRKLAMPAAEPPRHPRVSDHAVLRWMERHLQFDIEAIRQSMLTPERIDAIRCGAAYIHCREEGMTLVVSDTGTVTTALKSSHRNSARNQR